MENQKILDSAPKGATHYECVEYMRNICDDEWEYWSKAGGWQDTHPESETRSLEDIRRIVELEAYQVRAETLINELHMQIFPTSYMDNRVMLYKAINNQVK
jgi:hypothetical protein